MRISERLDALHAKARANRWMRYFAIFNRLGLAAGFIPSGIVKIWGERFTSLSSLHPMGNYLDAVYRTGFYYTFVGIIQVVAGVLLLIPRTATLGAMIYFPVILNICILSLSIRFEGSLFSSPLMVIANLFLLCWDYHKLKYILPFHHTPPQRVNVDNRFPKLFFAGVLATVVGLALLVMNMFEIYPRINSRDCNTQCKGSKKEQACLDFCHCIHLKGESLQKCLDAYNKAPADASK